jgi:hypothetical protein
MTSTWQPVDVDELELAHIARKATREFDWPLPELDEDTEAWLFVHENAAAGFATFRRIPNYAVSTDDDWELTHVWLHPSLRREGHLRCVWPEWRELYGDFGLFEPNPSMEAATEALDKPRDEQDDE